MDNDRKMTITEVAEIVGVVPKTLVRWEKSGKIQAAKKNWRGWRVYSSEELEEIKKFYESLY